MCATWVLIVPVLASWVSFVAAAATFFFLIVLMFALEVATTLGVYGFFVTILAWVGFLAFRLRGQGIDRGDSTTR